MKRVTPLILVVALLLSLLVLPAAAGVSDKVVVCGIDVTKSDCGITTYWVSDGSGGITEAGATAANAIVTYYPATKTLALDNATLTKAETFDSGTDRKGVIYSLGSLNLNVRGTCSIEPDGLYATSCYGIFVVENGYETGELHFTGDGSLSVLGGLVSTTTSYERAVVSSAIYTRDSIYFDGPDVSAESRDVQINNPLHAHNAFSYGVACDNGKIMINKGSVTVACGVADSKSAESNIKAQAFREAPEFDRKNYVAYAGSIESIALWDEAYSLTDYQVVELRAVKVLDEVAVTVAQPRTGEATQFTAISNNPKVEVIAVFWHHNGESMKATDVFQAKEVYYCDVWLQTEPGYRFGGETELTLNGKTPQAEWDDIDATDAIIDTTFYTTCSGNGTCPSYDFTDVPAPSNWAHEGIDFCVERDLFKGTSETTFSPNGYMTRAMLVAVLYRLEGSVPVAETNIFSDVPTADSCWYRDAVNWASVNDIVSGVGYGKFAPNEPVTREQIAALLYRYAGMKGYDTSDGVMLAGFADEGSISSWAGEALAWAFGMGLIVGTENAEGRFLMPLKSATRAEVAALFMRFMKLPKG